MQFYCKFCEDFYTEEYVELDPHGNGFWCLCDGYNYIQPTGDEHRFTLILEDKQTANSPSPQTSIRFKKQLSVLRYPGGKSKIIPYIYSKLRQKACKKLYSPFAGGASVELAMLAANVAREIVLNDWDFGIYALFWTIKHSPYDLIMRIRDKAPTHEDYFRAQERMRADYAMCTITDAAWSILVVNRLAFSGIYRANPLGGRNGSREALLSRWKPDALCKRITAIHRLSDRITVTQKDACEVIEEAYWDPHSTIFIDPPYVARGEQLYRCHYTQEDHLRLSHLLDSLHHGMPGADIILCYDKDPLIERIYETPNVETFNRVYSV